MKIDLHTHILPERWPDWTKRSGYPGWAELEHTGPGCGRMCRTIEGGGRQFFRDVRSNLWDPVVRLQEMEATGVTVQVLSTVPVMFSHWAKARDAYDLHRVLNDHIAGVVATHSASVHEPALSLGADPAAPSSVSHPRNDATQRSRPGILRPFEGLGVLPMQDPDLACRELDRCVRDLGLLGVQMGTHVEGKNLDDPMLRPVLARAADLGAAVFVHPWDMLGGERMARYWMPWLVGMPTETTIAIMSVLFGGVLDGLPSLRICFAHGGGSFAGTLGRIAHGFECRRDLFPEAARHPSEYVKAKRFWVDSLVHDAVALRHLVDLLGPSRVALGSDYPFPLGEDRPGELIESLRDLSTSDREMLLSGAAMQFLGRLPA